MLTTYPSKNDRSGRWRQLAGWSLVYAALWALLSHNQGWSVGWLFIVTAAYCSQKLGAALPSIAWQHLPAFLAFFISKLMIGGVDVALRTITTAPTSRAGWVRYSLTTCDTRIQLLLSALLGLVPGTLAARIDQQSLVIHCLDTDMDWQSDTAALESLLCRLMSTEQETTE